MRTRINRARQLASKHSFFLAPKTSLAKPFMRESSTSSSVVIFAEKPLPLEKREHFVERMQQQATAEINKPLYKDHLLFMSYFTRVAGKHETLEKASHVLGPETMDDVGLGYIDHLLLPGHCLLTVIDSPKKMALEHTFSLRPDLKKKPFYKAPTAPDQRLPSHIVQKETSVWPARHTSFEHEINVWANAAFYASYVHSERPLYPLHFLLKPLVSNEKEHYFSALKDLKSACEQYSLLDHFPPVKGESLNNVVSSQNCTILFRLFEKLINPTADLKKILGDNPTPQLMTKVLREHYFKTNKKEGELLETQNEEVFSKAFNRSA